MSRAALRWTVATLAERSCLARNTILKVEAGEPVRVRTTSKMREAFEAAGLEFVAPNGVLVKTGFAP